jgi:multidrug efflux pump subunit AcrB
MRGKEQDKWNAAIDAANHRLRPILLTAAAAILGVSPIAREVANSAAGSSIFPII